jgi:hypothetical protein
VWATVSGRIPRAQVSRMGRRGIRFLLSEIRRPTLVPSVEDCGAPTLYIWARVLPRRRYIHIQWQRLCRFSQVQRFGTFHRDQCYRTIILVSFACNYGGIHDGSPKCRCNYRRWMMVGCELAIAVFVHPTLDKLPDDVHLPAASALRTPHGYCGRAAYVPGPQSQFCAVAMILGRRVNSLIS